MRSEVGYLILAISRCVYIKLLYVCVQADLLIFWHLPLSLGDDTAMAVQVFSY